MPFYIIQESGKGYIKIGKGYAGDRIEIFMTGNPHDMKILKQLPGGYREEHILHKIFFRDKLRYRREWFYPSEELLKFASLETEEIYSIIDKAESFISNRAGDPHNLCLAFKDDTEEEFSERVRKYAEIEERSKPKLKKIYRDMIEGGK